MSRPLRCSVASNSSYCYNRNDWELKAGEKSRPGLYYRAIESGGVKAAFPGELPMLVRAIIAFLVLPGVVAFGLPLGFIGVTRVSIVWPMGFIFVALGTIALLWCVRDFYVSGKGTLAPWAPPQKLVTVGLYRFSRNPMYVAVSLILLGWSALFLSSALAIYALTVIAAFHLRITLAEEPWLAQKHGEEWQNYARNVRRWL